jgi:hypothetical protein
MTLLVPCRPMSSLKVPGSSIILGLIIAGSLVDSRVIDLIIGLLIANSLVVALLIADFGFLGNLSILLFTPYIVLQDLFV